MRIGIVNDMPMAVEALRRVVAGVPEYQTAWIAYNGAEAVAKSAADPPDLILMDLIMPVMDGVEATRRIMQQSPCPILVVTATVSGNASKVFDAMGHGALDAVNTPVLGLSGKAEGDSALLIKIATIGKLIGKHREPAAAKPARMPLHPAVADSTTLIAIGASTGGPLVIGKILAGLPPALQAAVVIIQHVDVEFAPGLASWLSEQSSLPVRTANEGDTPAKGKALLAATNDHLILTKSLSVSYTRDPKEFSYRPSADVFFKSVAAYWPGNAMGVLLTGMGRDGGHGLLAMRNRGWHTIAQDRETSIVYGMPKMAAELNAAVEILPAEAIAPAIMKQLKRNGRTE